MIRSVAEPRREGAPALELAPGSDDPRRVGIRGTKRSSAALRGAKLTDRQRSARWAELVDAMNSATPEEVLSQLRASKLDIDDAPPHCLRPLVFALAIGRVDIACSLLENGADPNPRPGDHASPLSAAVMSLNSAGAIEVMERMLQAHANINARGTDGFTPLLRAVWDARSDLIPFLLQRGADPRLGFLGGMSPLHLAARRQDAALVTQLLSAGGNPHDVADAELELGAREHQPDRIREARARGGSLGPPLFPLATALQSSAALSGDLSTATLLLELGADTNLPREAPPLVTASAEGRSAIVRLLLDHGARPDLRNSSGKSALKAALLRIPDAETLHLLLSRVAGLSRSKAAEALGTTTAMVQRAEAYLRVSR